MGKVAVVHSSREYRDVLKTCGLALQDLLKGTSDAMKSRPGAVAAGALLQRATGVDTGGERAVDKVARAQADPAFWAMIQSLVMAGSGPSAATVLETHSSYKSLFSCDASSLTGMSVNVAFHVVQKLLLSMLRHAGADGAE
ncbi:Nuclear pore complex protein Nup85 [Phytophthora cinnamomi]|uniref:Nuclear pore complex protein Nup85 n=1 Tax=Phytophthora cinnamomi TaxID=4785 RepID=UPI00355A0ABD|nr:Nuclear pore complex protein Nup85 [Phytophthora cinnamomi]